MLHVDIVKLILDIHWWIISWIIYIHNMALVSFFVTYNPVLYSIAVLGKRQTITQFIDDLMAYRIW